ncbi:TetR/AcrR family transcriptional regulator [Tsukamurella soli]|uniref:TetR family transcriptional regulator n=1 Tax=Tsukamurella soli TaxID=644556 RepID=A0ABP8JFD8_9ACTN
MTARSERTPRPRSGRRAGAPDTRAQILAAARTLFAAGGFERTSVRTIAADARVDPALVHHYFGTKQDLYLAALAVPVDPEPVLAAIRATPLGAVAHALLSGVIPLWDGPLREAGVAVIRTQLGGSGDPALVRGFLQEIVLAELTERMEAGPGDGALRASLVAAQVFGLIAARHVLRLEPLASLPAAAVAAAYAPPLQRLISGPLARP